MQLPCRVKIIFLVVSLSVSHSGAKTKYAKSDISEDEENFESQSLISSQDFKAIMGKFTL